MSSQEFPGFFLNLFCCMYSGVIFQRWTMDNRVFFFLGQEGFYFIKDWVLPSNFTESWEASLTLESHTALPCLTETSYTLANSSPLTSMFIPIFVLLFLETLTFLRQCVSSISLYRWFFSPLTFSFETQVLKRSLFMWPITPIFPAIVPNVVFNSFSGYEVSFHFSMHSAKYLFCYIIISHKIFATFLSYMLWSFASSNILIQYFIFKYIYMPPKMILYDTISVFLLHC